MSASVDAVLGALRSHGIQAKRSGHQWAARCPAHEDARASLSVAAGHSGAVLRCFAGCTTDAVVAALGLKMSELFDEMSSARVGDTPRAEIETVYSYHDEAGATLYEAVRYRPKAFKRRRPDGRGGYTWNLRGVRQVLYRLPQVIEAAALERPILLVEGEKDVSTAEALGQVATTVIGGANAWRDEYAESLAGATVVLIPDADAPGEQFALAAGKSCLARGCAVRILRLPRPHKDLSDWAAAGGTTEELAASVAQAEPWPDVQSAETPASTTPPTKEKIRRAPDRDPSDTPYRATPAGFVYTRQFHDAVVEEPLTNWTACITGDIVRDDGTESLSRAVDLEATLAGRTTRFTIPARQLDGLSWVVENLGSGAIVQPGQMKAAHAVVAIKVLSPSRVERRVYVHTGWRSIEGDYVYLHAGGAIGANGLRTDVHVDLGSGLNGYALPAPPSGLDAAAAVRASLAVLDLAPDRITVPLLAAAYRAPLGAVDSSIHLAGETGCFKSELAALALQHFGAPLDARHLPGSWSSTANALEAQAFALKDAVFAVDDFAPQGSAAAQAQLQTKADRLYRGQGNAQGRARMNADSSLRTTKFPRGLILSTGEDTPSGQSIRARMSVVDVSGGDVDAQRLTACQKDARDGRYAESMAGYLQWLAPKMATMGDCIRTEVAALRDQVVGERLHRRTPSAVAELAVGWQHFLRFARETGAIDQSQYEVLGRRVWSALHEVVEAQAEHQRAADPVDRFRDLLASTLTSGIAHVARPDGTQPEHPERWGWQRLTSERGEDWKPSATDTWRPHGQWCVGWVDGSDLYLDPNAAMEACRRIAGTGGDGVALTQTELAKRLHGRGALRSVDRRARSVRYKVRRTILDDRRNVLHLGTDWLAGASDEVTTSGGRGIGPQIGPPRAVDPTPVAQFSGPADAVNPESAGTTLDSCYNGSHGPFGPPITEGRGVRAGDAHTPVVPANKDAVVPEEVV